jgi:SPP1 family predicted phage head-tail adaptor
MAIRSGSLNRLVRFERRASAADAFNEEVGDWIEYAQARAQIVSLGAEETFAAMQAQSAATSRVVVRYTAQLEAVKANDRVVTVNAPFRVFDITSPPLDPDGRMRELNFLVAEHDESRP